MKDVTDVMSGIRETIGQAEEAYSNFCQAFGPKNAHYRDEQEEIAKYFLDRAFLELRLFLEAKGLLQMLRVIASHHIRAKKDLMKGEMASYGEPYSFWAERLRKYVKAVATTFEREALSIVTKDIVEILRATIYSITDPECFTAVPKDEQEVHVRIEAVLRCVFPTLLHKPVLLKPIKNFEPDTGLPSVQTLIEYKFVSTKADVKRVVDEVLADTRGYASKDWKQFVYVIYETKRLKPEAEWRSLLSTSGVGQDTQIIVICGEVPPKRADRRSLKARRLGQKT